MCSWKQAWGVWDHAALRDLLRAGQCSLAPGRVPRGCEWAPPAGNPQPASLPWPSRVGPQGRQPQGIWTPEAFGSGPAAAPAQLLGLRGLLAAGGGEGSS